MDKFETEGRCFDFLWASHPDLDGLRLEVSEGDVVVMDITVPVDGKICLNTFGHEVPADLVKIALDVAIEDRKGWR